MKPAEERQVLSHFLVHDLAAFIHMVFLTVSPGQTYLPNWHVEAMAWHLKLCAEGRVKRLLITLPPRNLKSICASVAFVAWLLGRNPARRIICASYSEGLASKHSLDCRAVMGSSWYRRLFPATRLSRDKNTELDFVTTRGGYRYSTSVGGTLTGRGGDTIILDDPLKPEDAFSELKRKAANEWFYRTLYSRLDSKRDDVIIVIMQRLHLDDLVGHVLQREKWEHLNLPAIAEVEERIQTGPSEFHVRNIGDVLHPEREPLETLEGLKKLGTFNFSAQYLQRPIPVEGEIVKWGWFLSYDELPPQRRGNEIVQSWDTKP